MDGKLISVNEPEPVQEAAHEMLYHIDPRQPEEEPRGFNTVAEYDRFLKDNGLWKEDAPRIVLTGQMGEPRRKTRRASSSQGKWANRPT